MAVSAKKKGFLKRSLTKRTKTIETKIDRDVSELSEICFTGEYKDEDAFIDNSNFIENSNL